MQVPPEILSYVDEGRNPDIYSREFVETVQRGNVMLKGRAQGLAGFRDALRDELVELWGEEGKDVVDGLVVDGKGRENGVEKRAAENGVEINGK